MLSSVQGGFDVVPRNWISAGLLYGLLAMAVVVLVGCGGTQDTAVEPSDDTAQDPSVEEMPGTSGLEPGGTESVDPLDFPPVEPVETVDINRMEAPQIEPGVAPRMAPLDPVVLEPWDPGAMKAPPVMPLERLDRAEVAPSHVRLAPSPQILQPRTMTVPTAPPDMATMERASRMAPEPREVRSLPMTEPMASEPREVRSLPMTEPMAPVAEVDPDTGAHLVQVFYATDRRPLGEDVARIGFQVYAATIAGGLVTILLGLATVFLRRRVVLGVMTVVCALVTAFFFHSANLETQKDRRLVGNEDRVYGSDRHQSADGYQLEVGTCQVSIPPDHRVGAVESPSILRLEFRENPEKHVILDRVVRQEEDEFYDELETRIQQSPAKQAFVFIHGYNVEFESAVKRTAQIAFDLKFAGAPICYSWPSKGGLAEYTRDESNVTWTVTHLEHFLNQVIHRTGARTVHLVAHSMGNRALVQALERMALQQNPTKPMFGQLVMAAPDIDAAEFRDRYAPAVTRMASHVTLYASANDRALAASTKVHGYTRAGLSGDSMAVVPGIETVDVSQIDTSLIGHSYYGDNPLMIRDMQALVELSIPAANRPWLEQIVRSPGLAYWVFRQGVDGSVMNVGRGITLPGLHR